VESALTSEASSRQNIEANLDRNLERFRAIEEKIQLERQQREKELDTIQSMADLERSKIRQQLADLQSSQTTILDSRQRQIEEALQTRFDDSSRASLMQQQELLSRLKTQEDTVAEAQRRLSETQQQSREASDAVGQIREMIAEKQRRKEAKGKEPSTQVVPPFEPVSDRIAEILGGSSQSREIDDVERARRSQQAQEQERVPKGITGAGRFEVKPSVLSQSEDADIKNALNQITSNSELIRLYQQYGKDLKGGRSADETRKKLMNKIRDNGPTDEITSIVQADLASRSR
jgi:hypothetical protein